MWRTDNAADNLRAMLTTLQRRFRLPPQVDGSRREANESTPLSLLSRPYVVMIFFAVIISAASAAVPRFFESNRMAMLLLPEDTPTDSIVYRLRAEDSDRDYPLLFQVKGPIGVNLIYIESHECTPSNDVFCEADVYLRKPVEIGRLYIFNLSVSDQRGQSTEVAARIDATNGRATSTSDIFIRYFPTIGVREDTPVKSIISMMIVRKRHRSTFTEFQVLGSASKMFRMVPSNLVSPETINGTLVLETKLDYETANLHTFKVCILQPFTQELVDTRNIACVLESVIVDDVQDEPPIFVKANPVTRILGTAVAGDKLTQLEAKDGDRGIPRPIRYSILPETSIYTKYFSIDSFTGVISLSEPAIKLRDNMVSLDPILMTVTAEEVTKSPDSFPALSASVEIAFVSLGLEFLTPQFVHEKYVGEIYENSLPDTEVSFNSPFFVKDLKGLFALELQGDKGAFSVSPGVMKDVTDISIKVKNSFLVDFERNQQIAFKLVARQIQGITHGSGSAEITVKVIDVNDNVPQFSQQQYEVEIYENITRGTSIIRVYATDEDTGPFGIIRYTNLDGPVAGTLSLDPVSGIITCATDNHNFDRELASEHIITVEVKDNNGRGPNANTATAKILIRVKDVNDNAPKFEESIYKGVMAPDLERLRDPIRIRAFDADMDRPNNEIAYEIEKSSYSDFFSVDRRTGYLDVRQNFIPSISGLNSGRSKRALHDNDTVISLRVRATDLGDPPLSNTVDVKIFKQEYGERVVKFIYPKAPRDVRTSKRELESTLNALTGGTTEIMGVRSFVRSGYLIGDIDPEKSEVTALVRFGLDTVVNVEDLISRLNNSEVQKLQTLSQQRQVVITSLEDVNKSYVIGVVFLCLILAIIIIVLILCCICEECPLYRYSKTNMIQDDGSEGVSYIRVDENGKYRSSPDDPAWWQCMPQFMKEIILLCGYIPPGRSRSRLAWSGDQRQRFGRINQPPDGSVVEDRSGMVQAMQRPRDPLPFEDLDAGRMNRQVGRQPVRVDSRNSQFSQPEPRRVFVLKDALGNPRGEDALREGNTYLLEDIEDSDPNITRMSNGLRNGGGYEEDDLAYQQGNLQALRLHASQHDAATYNNERLRRARQAGVEAEGLGTFPDDSRGFVQRFVDGQPVGPSNGYNSLDSYNNRYNIQTRIAEDHEPHSLPDLIRSKSFKDKLKGKTRNAPHPPDVHQIDKSTDPLDPNARSSRASNIPGTYGYQHTKTSILRYENNKAKIEEVREEMIKQGKDPDMCSVHQGLGGTAFSESRNGSVRGSKRSYKHEENVGYQYPPYPMPASRRSSLTDIETKLEKEAAKRHIRRSSAGGQEYYDDQFGNRARELVYDSDMDKTDEIERRRLERRSQASEALSEKFMQPNAAILQQQQQQIHQLSQQIQQQQQFLQQQQSRNDGTDSVQPNSNLVEVADIHSQGQAITVGTNAVNEPIYATSKKSSTARSRVTKEAIERAIAAAASDLTDVTNYNQLSKITNTDINKKKSFDELQTLPSIEGNDTDITDVHINNSTFTKEQNINITEASTTKTIQDKTITNDLNLSDDVKSLQTSVKSPPQDDLPDDLTIREKNIRNDASVLNIPKDKKKRSKMEKKSIFTIAYDGMKTDQLRPDSGSSDT